MTINSPTSPARSSSRPVPRRWPWTDRAGRIDPLKALVFALLFVPALVLAGRTLAGTLGPRPLNEAILVTGLWTVRLLLLSLLITPWRQVWHQARLVTVRRMIGVAAMAYALGHLGLYAADQQFDLTRITSEIILRLYLTVGFVAVLILVALGVTSTDGMIRRLGGPGWRRLHQLAYGAMALGAVHFFMQSKLDVSQATWMAGIFLWAMLYRLWRGLRPGQPIPRPPALAGLAVVAGVLTAAGEALYFSLFTRIPGDRLLAANWDWHLAPRPGAIVLVFGLATALIAWGLKRWRPAQKKPGRR